MPEAKNIEIDVAHQIIERGREAAAQLGLNAVIAILDTGANLVAFARMDGAWLASNDLAIAKARTSVMFQAPSEALGLPLVLGQPAPHFDHLNGGLLLMGGGHPIVEDGVLVGAVGVSGGTPEQDAEVARSALR
ncbi:hypothetical protein GOEFS_095_00190 [Gordonia effusa NBRC 100432]|uniref:Heme-binding protein n=1 Tax=Gordonia effusa NBRC 100432 TaxID=1077974 RepID=H0R3Y3_9ACTN|nr:heme-binding protein [Gordonia effusa]GAB19784.1 hypothetical protein GOEFS_095_00190 [Gordonia effusa NBRC 100432]